MAGVPASGAGPGDLKSTPSYASVSWRREVDRSRYLPSNGKTHTNRAPVDPGLFSPPLWYNTGQFHLLPACARPVRRDAPCV